ncbi:hypothetical protein L6654_26675 [Bradyrhizobium sp. WYCCWR 13023]|uniref:Uncharacterized protein n=1 Tax=Bradyrhizobium zhengyangense TaxID=2911009 RepID=A0A9X1RFM3_9BRAD|nr:MULTISPECIES: hypothetical protein [Bradyrhizobium]MCG2630218.1 hypothetical protein [Bradyrhizobium zhengyangense]MDA9521057.1 hypothetical protein [Bradyrhizobium sp. CCBAU 11434]
MTVTVELLARTIGLLPASDDTEAALDFLKQSDLIKIVPSGLESSLGPAEESLRICRIRQTTTSEAGTVTYGFPSLLSALEKLRPTELLTSTVFATAGWYGTFLSDQANRLVGYMLVKRRSPEEEAERLDWFWQNLT